VPAFEQLSLAPSLPAESPRTERSFAAVGALDTVARAAKLAHDLKQPLAQEDDAARDRLAERISSHLPGARLILGLTNNRFTMISVKREVRHAHGPLYRVRLHHMFLDAPTPITRFLARYIVRNERAASRELSRFISENQSAIQRDPDRPRPEVPIVAEGRFFNLDEVYADVNRRYFDGAISARITWSPKNNTRRRRTSMKMGSYSVEERLIRIHPALDRPFVPRFFLDWIVYHEMLHQVHDMPIVDGRRRYHTPAFLTDEKKFEHYELARHWERTNLERLLDF
jgi:hypothetical protein